MIHVLRYEVGCPGLPSMIWYKIPTRIKYQWPGGKFHDPSFLKTPLFAPRPVFQPGFHTGVLIKIEWGMDNHPQRSKDPLGRRAHLWGSVCRCLCTTSVSWWRGFGAPCAPSCLGITVASFPPSATQPAQKNASFWALGTGVGWRPVVTGSLVSEHKPDTGTRLWRLNGQTTA